MAGSSFRRRLWLVEFALLALCVIARGQDGGPRHLPPIVFSQTVTADGTTIQIDFAEGTLDLPRAAFMERIQVASHDVALYYGRFPVAKARIVIVPVPGRHGVLGGTTWGNVAGVPALLRLRIGQSTTSDELGSDWVITHELVHTAMPSLPDEQHWLEEGLASYIEPIARAQAGQLDVAKVWADMRRGMPNGEPGPGDQGLDVTHTWGRTYWGGALFCLIADVEIRKQTRNRTGLQDALRAVVSVGGAIDREWPLERVLATGDQATGTKVLSQMYAQWAHAPVPIDLTHLWMKLGIRDAAGTAAFDLSAPDAKIRAAITMARENQAHVSK